MEVKEVSGLMTKNTAVRVVEVTNGVRLVIAKDSAHTHADLSISEARHIAKHLYRLAAKASKAT